MPKRKNAASRTSDGDDSPDAVSPEGARGAAAGPSAATDSGDRSLHPALSALLGEDRPNRRRVQHFLSHNRFPLVEPGAVTFVFHGEAEAVYLRHFMSGIPNGVPFDRIAGSRLWHLRFPLLEGSRFEYKLDVVRKGEGAWINDPLNPCQATDPFGANSVGWSFGYEPPDWTRPDPKAPAGRMEAIPIESRAFGEKRSVGLYMPAGHSDDDAYPVVLLHDGEDFVQHAGLTTCLDNLIHGGHVPAFVAVLTQPGERNGEYTDDPRHADFLTGEVLPTIRERYPIRPGPENSVLLGASLGAIASVAAAFRHPGVYGALALLSGSFIFDRKLAEVRDPLFGRVADFVEELRKDWARLPDRAFVGCGLYEELIGQNRTFARRLRDHGVQVRFQETRDAHHWQNWRDQLRVSLSWSLPPDQ
jgi:enterochelin esterase-like enzyme